MKRDRAAYMREYRASKKAAHERYDEAKPLIGHLKTLAHEQAERIVELEAEVARLKRDLALHPTEWPLPPHLDPTVAVPAVRFNSRPFTPVPKRGK
jgi:hypothetical protein